jgi:uncharacterized protein (TIGR03437 family)
MRTSNLALITLLAALAVPAQTLSNTSLSGKYFLRHVEFTTDAKNNVTDARSITGYALFGPGPGTYTFTGQQVVGTGAAGAFTATGAYSVNSAGLVTIANPQKSGATINARYGAEAVVGSSTETSDNTFDIFVAIPAPGTVSGPSPTNAAVMGTWNATDFELTATTAQVRSSFVQFAFDGAGNIPTLTLQGHAANYNSGVAVSQTPPPGVYAINSDGTGNITFAPPAGLPAQAVMLGATQRQLMVSASGHVLLMATPGAHDIMIAIQSPSAAPTLTRDWLTGIRVDSTGYSDSYAGSSTTVAADASLISSRRFHQTGSPSPIAYNISEATIFTVSSDGTGSAGPAKIAGGAAGLLSANVGGVFDPTGYEISFGVPIPALTGGGVFVNPQGVVNAASNAPVGNPIAPGEFIAIYGTNLANQTSVSTPPYPSMLGGVTVSIGGLPAPIYLVAGTQINCLVPYALNTSQPANIVVTNNNVASNTVSVPVSATSPGIFSNDTSGTGDGAVIHLNGTLVNAANPAVKGEVLSIYLTGLGILTTPLKDGTSPNPPAADAATAQVAVYVNGISANYSYAGINPSYPGLYQINFTVPTTLTVSGELPLAIQTPDSFHDQINLSVQ